MESGCPQGAGWHPYPAARIVLGYPNLRRYRHVQPAALVTLAGFLGTRRNLAWIATTRLSWVGRLVPTMCDAMGLVKPFQSIAAQPG